MILYRPDRPFIQIISDYYSFCEGTTVTCTAATWYTGIHPPHYQWYLNDVLQVGETNSTYVSDEFVDDDEVYCKLTGTLYGDIQSNTITFLVVAQVTPTIVINYSSRGIVEEDFTFCVGDIILFDSICTYQGSSPSYQWQHVVKAGWVDLTGKTESSMTYAPVNGEQIRCLMTSSLSCIVTPPAISNILTMVMNTVYPVSVSITADPLGSVCEGTEIEYTASGSNGGSSPTYAWTVNGGEQGETTAVFNYTPDDDDVIEVEFTSNYSCATENPAYAQKVAAVRTPCVVSIAIESTPQSVWADPE